MKSLFVLALVSATIVVASCVESSGRSSGDLSMEQVMNNVLEQGTQPEEIVTRRLESNDQTAWNSAGFSHDGRYLSYVRIFEDGDIAIRDLATGESKQLTFDGTAWENWALASVFSTAGDRVAYIWYEEYEHQLYLKTVETDGSNMQTVLHTTDANWLRLFDWSPDDESLLINLTQKPEKGDEEDSDGIQFALMSLPMDGGEATTIRVFEENEPRPRDAFYSPDGRYIAYSGQTNGSSPTSNAYLLDVETGSIKELVARSIAERVVGWNSAGTKVFVSSFREGNPSLWSVPVEDGVRSGDPVLIRRDMHGAAVGQVAGDQLFYWVMAQTPRVHTVELDISAGRVINGPFEEPGTNMSNGFWSPDGRYLAYPRPGLVVVRSMDGLYKQEFAFPEGFGKNGRKFRWSPESDEFSFRVRGPSGGTRLVLNLESGEIRDDGRVSLYSGATTHDGSFSYGLNPSGIKQYDRVEKSDQMIFEPKTKKDQECWAGTLDLRLSPDDTMLVIGSTRSEEDGPLCIGIYSFQKENLRWIYTENQAAQEWPLVRFSPDGKRILFTLPGSGEELEAWMLPIDATESNPQKIFSFEGLGGIDLHPDGRHLAFTGGRTAVEFWVMEGLDSVTTN